MKIREKNEAVRLRKSGLTYSEILNRLAVSKSSLSHWLRNVELTDSQKDRIYNKDLDVRRKFVEYNDLQHKKSAAEKEEIFTVASNEINSISDRDLKLIGIALYWAEGYKAVSAKYVEFTNSDPAMVRLIMRWFREVCAVSDDKFRIKIQIHDVKNINNAIDFWSSNTGIPYRQFTKPYVKISPSSYMKMGNILENGTCHIRIADIKLLEKIRGWINGIGGPIV